MEDYKSPETSDNQPSKKSIRGYQIIIILLVVVLAVLAVIYFRQVKTLKEDYQIEKETLSMRINELIIDIDNIEVENDSISHNLGVERNRADSLMDKLQSERTLNRTTVRKYEQELGTMRTIMRRYVHQIDSLNQLNRTLAQENLDMRQAASSERARAERAEERASELTGKVQRGSVVRAREIRLIGLNTNDREVQKASRAARLGVDFILSANDLATPGERDVYVRITGPDGYVLAGDTNSLFDFEGDKITFSAKREVDYQGQDLSIGLYYNGAGIESGLYRVEVFMDGARIGETETALK